MFDAPCVPWPQSIPTTSNSSTPLFRGLPTPRSTGQLRSVAARDGCSKDPGSPSTSPPPRHDASEFRAFMIGQVQTGALRQPKRLPSLASNVGGRKPYILHQVVIQQPKGPA